MASKSVLKLMNDSNMDTPVDSFDHLEPIPSRYGLSAILSTVIFFQVMNKCIISATGLNKNVSELSKKEWQRRNLLISWIHAFIVSIWDILSFYFYWDEFSRDLVAYHNMFVYIMIAFSTGYFLYDFVDIVQCLGWMAHWEVLAHHTAVSSMFFYNVATCRCIPYNAVALLAEVNSFFLHTRKLLQLNQWPFDHWFYRLSAWCNLISFPFCRFIPLTVIYWGMWNEAHRVSYLYFTLCFMSIFVMTGINVVLFWRLFKSDVLRAGVLKKNHGDGSAIVTSPKENGGPICDVTKEAVNNNGHVANGFAPHEHQE